MPTIGATPPPIAPPPITPQASAATAPTQSQNPMGSLQRAGGQRALQVEPQPAKPGLVSRMGQRLASGIESIKSSFKSLTNYMASKETPRPPMARGPAAQAQAAPAKMSLDELKAARAAYPKAAELAEFKQKMASLSVLEKGPYLMSLPKDGLVRTEYLKFAEQKMLAENINFLTALEEGQDFESLYENFINPPNDSPASALNLSTQARVKAESAKATLDIVLQLPGGDGEIVSHARQGCDDALAMCKREIMSQLGQALSAGSNSDFLKTPLFDESPYKPVAEPRRPMTDADFAKGSFAYGAEPSHRPEPAVTRSDYDSKLTETRTQARFLESVKAGRLVELAATDPQKLIDVINAQPADSPILKALKADVSSNFKQVHNFVTRFDNAMALAPGPQRDAAMDSLYESCVKLSLDASPFAKGNEFEVNLDGSTLPKQAAAAKQAGTGMSDVMKDVKAHLMLKLKTERMDQNPVVIFTKDLQKVL